MHTTKTTTTKSNIQEGQHIDHPKHGRGIVRDVHTKNGNAVTLDVYFLTYGKGSMDDPTAIRKVYVSNERFSIVKEENRSKAPVLVDRVG